MLVACIPAYNVEKTIGRLVIQAQKHVDKVIVCDDGSKDTTAEIAERLGAIVVVHKRNLGYGAAISSLFRESRKLKADVVVTLDGDGQHDPNAIPFLIKPIVRGRADVIIGSRLLVDKPTIPAYRRLGIGIITALQKINSKHSLTDAQSGLRAYNRKALDLLEPFEYGMGASAEILMKAYENRLIVKEVPIKAEYNVENPSTHNPVYQALDVITSIIKYNSIRHPLLFYGLPGLSLALIGIGFGFWAFDIFSKTRQFTTNITLIAIGSLMSGLLLMTTAIILFTLTSLLREFHK